MSTLSYSYRVVNQELSQIAFLNEMASEMERKGEKVKKYSGGDPSHFPSELKEMLSSTELLADKSIMNYSPIAGFEELRTSLAEITNTRYCEEINYNNILVSSGGCSGLFLSLKTILNSNDKVLIQDPSWEYLPKIIRNCQGIPVNLEYSFSECDDWNQLLTEVRYHIQNGIKALVINSPLNPLGKVIPTHIINEMIKICNEFNVWFISDDVTVDFNYTSESEQEITNLPNYISVQSFSKNLGLTGLRCGYVTGSKDFIDQLKKSQLYTFMYPNSLMQKVLYRFLNHRDHLYEDFVQSAVEKYRKRANNYAQILSIIPALEVKSPEGGLFLFPRVREGYIMDVMELLAKSGVAVAPGSAFSPKYSDCFRVFLGVEEEDILLLQGKLESYFLKQL
ncbi:pyridoxal phosphate-dependent aminotransferase [Paenibacillus sp.]|jgi:aspartate/methionine/tyrosine aminotransferase|uniref:pyridoxal phosphate-dependent aminotransferase n=1 Tax=Paenibacillus sp. TaxID=58172 RepID=UPI002839A6F2|nr:pyridoxal phosphate-dependent aminotransferase [Paenibacillus sp.]MDR0270821.1 pyridoxal phosphate-dependent aminotransferase [Paenibacillus sp.]